MLTVSDDIELGAGGTIAKWVNEGHMVNAVVMSAYRDEVLSACDGSLCSLGVETVGIEGLPDQAFDTWRFTRIVKIIEHHLRLGDYDTILTHCSKDLNKDHRITHEAVLTATRPHHTTVKMILGFEVPSSTEWNFSGDAFRPNWFEDIDLNPKVEALECYTTEIKSLPHPRSMEGIMDLASHRGYQCGVYTAEAFELVRRIP